MALQHKHHFVSVTLAVVIELEPLRHASPSGSLALHTLSLSLSLSHSLSDWHHLHSFSAVRKRAARLWPLYQHCIPYTDTPQPGVSITIKTRGWGEGKVCGGRRGHIFQWQNISIKAHLTGGHLFPVGALRRIWRGGGGCFTQCTKLRDTGLASLTKMEGGTSEHPQRSDFHFSPMGLDLTQRDERLIEAYLFPLHALDIALVFLFICQVILTHSLTRLVEKTLDPALDFWTR